MLLILFNTIIKGLMTITIIKGLMTIIDLLYEKVENMDPMIKIRVI